MTYQRVIPRDLFNEAKLLKCLGQLSLIAHDGLHPELSLEVKHHSERFDIEQRPQCGGLYANVRVWAGDTPLVVYSAYNSKSPFPLLCETDDGEINVFEDDGSLTEDFKQFCLKCRDTQ